MTMALAVTQQGNVGSRFGWLPLEEHFNKMSPPKTPIMTLTNKAERKELQIHPVVGLCDSFGMSERCLCHLSMQRMLTLHLVQYNCEPTCPHLPLDFLLRSHHPHYVAIYQLLFRMLTWRKSQDRHFMWEVLGSEDSRANGNPQGM